MTLNQTAQITAAKLIGNGNTQIDHLITDSRAVSFPERSLFFALKTPKNDGHRYIEDLYKAGVRNFVVSAEAALQTQLIASLPPDANFLAVPDTLAALQQIAAARRAQFHAPVIGITGSNGKTIVKEWLNQLLCPDHHITRSPRSYNSQIGVPLSVWQLVETDNYPSLLPHIAILEAGISQRNEMQNLQPVIRPTIGIFTHLGDAHQENFSSLKEKCLEKLKLFRDTQIIIYEKDNKLIDICVNSAQHQIKTFTWGKNANADIHIIKEEKTETGTTQITYSCPTLNIKHSSLNIPFTDAASIQNALTCLATLLYLGTPPETIAQRMAQLQPVSMRLEVKQGIAGSLIINDAYNSDLTSLAIALDFLAEQAAAKQMRRTLIMSDILQSGQSPEALYTTVAQLIKNKGVNQLIGIGEEIKNEEQRMKKILGENCQCTFHATTDEFLHSPLSTLHSPLSAVLLKGARPFHFEKIAEQLEATTHQTTLEINLNALVGNLSHFRSFLNPHTKIISMVKANAYGSGDIETARALQSAGIHALAVAVADEGEELRRAGIHLPIIVMNPETEAFGKIFRHRLEPEIYSTRILQAFTREAQRQGETNYPVHIKIDTGMSRLGFQPAQIDKLIEQLKAQNTLQVRSVFSHLVGSDDAQFDTFTHTQAERFSACAAKFETAFPHKILKHLLNSAGIERFPQYQFDMVRLGIGHYGISAVQTDNYPSLPNNPSPLQEVCTLRTTILQIRPVPPTETVGYSRKGTLHRDSLIAAIPIGYADGYDRRLGNGVGKVLINGHLVPTIGNICMDITLIDLTDHPAAREGDTVILFGSGLPITTIARTLNTIPYEVLTGISRRVRRIYFKE